MPDTYAITDLSLPEDSEIPALLRAFPEIQPVRFRNDEFLMRAGDTSLEIFLLLRGGCLVQHPGAPAGRSPGHDLAVLEASPDAPVFVGEMAYLGNGRRSASVRSVLSTWALRLEPRHIDAIIEEYPHLTRILCRQFALRLQETDEALHHFQAECVMDLKHVFLAPGERLFDRDAPADMLYQLIEGRIRLTGADGIRIVESSGHEPIFIEPGPFFRDSPHQNTAEAETPLTLLGIPRASKAAAVRNFPEIVLALL